MAKTKATLKVSERFNLKEIFGYDLPDDERLRLKIGNDIIEAIKKNTESGKDKNGKPFKKYSDSYAGNGKDIKPSLTFKAFGKRRTPVNMTLSGDMLHTMEIIKETTNTITVGWNDETQKLKAENHIHGITLPKRDFLGLPDEIIQKIKEKNEGLVRRAIEDELTARDEEKLDRQKKAEEF